MTKMGIVTIDERREILSDFERIVFADEQKQKAKLNAVPITMEIPMSVLTEEIISLDKFINNVSLKG